jgi:predicted AAA+ superfamily ATPase
VYIPRHIESVVQTAAQSFPAIILTGPRQVGKTTLLQQLNPLADYVTLDRLDTNDAARSDPERFLDTLRTPAIIDEAQYAPDLFRYVKIAIDAQRGEKGRFLLTGSQRFLMMQGIDESLAGRAAVVEMLGLSLREILGDAFREPFLPTQDYLENRRANIPHRKSLTLWDLILLGDLPELHVSGAPAPRLYYDSYIDTYLRRDVRDLAHVGDLAAFSRFMAFAALRHGQQLNKTDLASLAGVSVATANRWLSVLEASNIIYLLKPFYANSQKRLAKTPKLYFLNSGLAARLCRFSSGEELEQSPLAGAFFEGLVITEILKSHLNASGQLPEIYYYRDSNHNEIDLIIQDGFDLYPIEIKKSSRARGADTKTFKHLDSLSAFRRGSGAVICNSLEPLPLPDNNWAIPLSYI